MNHRWLHIVVAILLGLNSSFSATNSFAPTQWQEIRKLGRKGDAKACVVMGCLLENGLLLEKDRTAALEWYREGARLNAIDAQFNAAALLLQGGTNSVEAVNWLKASSTKGNVGAQIALALLYHEGKIVRRDFPQALQLFQSAASKGDGSAQLSLAIMYSNGEGSTQNKAKVAELTEKTDKHGTSRFPVLPLNPGSSNSLGTYPDDYKRDFSCVIQWFTPAANGGDAIAQYILGELYLTGAGVEHDRVIAATWFKKAADQNHAKATFELGCLYSGAFEGVPENKAERLRLFRKAAEAGERDAQCSLGEMYETGDFVTKDPSEAVKWYHKAALQGDRVAAFRFKNLANKLPAISQP